MIIGNGLIANAFKNSDFNHDNYVVFASGVSNSSEIKVELFNREFELIKSSMDKDKTFIYFSTVSIFDESLQQSPYIQFKKKVEKYIQKHMPSYLIIRLPILVSLSNNPFTLFNFFTRNILNNQAFLLHKYASRYLLDVDDIVPLIENEIEQKKNNISINMVLCESILVSEIVNILQIALGRKANFEFIDAGSTYTFERNLEKSKYSKSYNSDVIKKYAKQYLEFNQ